MSAVMMERLCMLSMYFIGGHYYSQQKAWQLDELARWLGVPLNVSESILSRLHDRQLILATSEGGPPFVPAHDMETLQVKQILDAVRAGGDAGGLMPWRLPDDPVVNQMLQAADDAIDQALGQQTLKDMVIAGIEHEAEGKIGANGAGS